VSDTLLATKFYIPAALPNLVRRQRLLSRLDEGLKGGNRLTLISAPAGYGKTTLLGEWIRSSEFNVAWLSLDEGDNDHARFLSYLITALCRIQPGMSDTGIDSSQLESPHSTLAPVINSLDEISGEVLVVFDDYHTIQNQTIHRAVSFLIENSPLHVHIVIASRADPPLPVALLRGRGQVTELRQSDLRFTRQEAAEFFSANPTLELSQEDITALANRTEGWAAGLQMASASLEEQSDKSSFILELTGSHRYILDYLIEEVLESQPGSIQSFLLYTSVLEQLNGSLCDALVNGLILPRVSSQQVLEDLERKNLFIVPLDNQRRWYRYHRLFSDLLKGRLMQVHPEIKPELHQRASEWYENASLPNQAIEHAFLADDPARAAQLIEGTAEAIFMQSQVRTYLNWLKKIPEKELRAHPALSVYYSWGLLWSGAPFELVEAQLQRLGEQQDQTAKSLPLQAFLAIYNGKVNQAESLALQALEQLPEVNRLLRSLANFILASTYLARGENTKGIHLLEQTARDSQRTGNVMIATLVLCELGDESQKHGNLLQAKNFYQQALELASDEGGQPLPVAGKALIGLGDLSREWNDYQAAEAQLTQGISLTKHWSVLGAFEGYLNLVMLKDTQGKRSEADELFSQVRELAYQFDASEVDDFIVEMFAARRNVRYGNYKAVYEWAENREKRGREKTSGSSNVEDILRGRLRKYEDSILVRLMIAEGNYEGAINLCDQVIAEAKNAKRVFLQIDVEILRAIAFWKSNSINSAMESLSTALSLAEPGGFIREFVDHDDQIVELLKYAHRSIKEPKLSAYIESLLNALKTKADQVPEITASKQKELVEALSEREADVLQLLPSSLSSTEMASELSISVNTLRSHLKSIYAKLNAHSRYEAISRAKELGLL
jgi:LuxR family maltose regulon positive regulatory protein